MAERRSTVRRLTRFTYQATLCTAAAVIAAMSTVNGRHTVSALGEQYLNGHPLRVLIFGLLLTAVAYGPAVLARHAGRTVLTGTASAWGLLTTVALTWPGHTAAEHAQYALYLEQTGGAAFYMLAALLSVGMLHIRNVIRDDRLRHAARLERRRERRRERAAEQSR